MTTAIPYNLKPKDTRLPAGPDPSLDPPALVSNPLLAAFRQNAWPRVDTSKGSTFPPDVVADFTTDPAVRGLAPFKWPKGVLSAIPNRPQREATIPVGALDPDIALWQNVIVSIWPFTGPPTVGSWPKGWLGIDNTSTLYVCTVAGDPGTWEPAVGGSTIVAPVTLTMPVGDVNGLTIQYVAGATGQAFQVIDDIGDPIMAIGPDGGAKVFGDHLGVVYPSVDFAGDELSFNAQTNPPSQTIAGTGLNGPIGLNTIWFTEGPPGVATILATGDVGIRTKDWAFDNVTPAIWQCTAGGTPTSATWVEWLGPPGTVVPISGTGTGIVYVTGAVGNGVADDSGVIQAAINTCPPGGTVLLPPPSVTYGIGSTLVLPAGGNITLASTESSVRTGFASTITMLAGANLDACIAEYYWYNNNASLVSSGITIRNLSVNANGANQTSGLNHCLAGKFFDSQVLYNAFVGSTGDGVLTSLVCRNGSTTDTVNHLIVNYFVGNYLIENVHGFVFNGGSTAFVTDGFVIDNVINGGASSNLGTGIQFSGNSGAGFLVSGNHLYVYANGITTGNVALITITNNYIEPSGAPASTGTLYQIQVHPEGITNFPTAHVIITGNKIGLPQSVVTGNTYRGIQVAPVGNVPTGGISVTGNVIGGGTSSSDVLLNVNPGGSTIGTMSLSGNTLSPTNGAVPFVNSTPAQINLSSSPIFAIGQPTTATDGFTHLPSCAGAPTGTPADLTQGIPFTIDTTDGKLWAYYGSAWHYATMT